MTSINAQAHTQKISRMALLLDGLTLYKGITEDKTVQAFQALLAEMAETQPKFSNILAKYHSFCNLALFNSWPDHLIDLILQDVNPFSRQAALTGKQGISSSLLAIATRDLAILQEIAVLSSQELRELAIELLSDLAPVQLDQTKPADALQPVNWPLWASKQTTEINPCCLEDSGAATLWLKTRQTQVKEILLKTSNRANPLDDLVNFYQEVGCGQLARFVAFRWQGQRGGSELVGIAKPDPLMLDQLIGLNQELQVILENTTHLLKGLPANNLILYGNRGTGKSSVIKSLLHKYAEEGLRLVELPKEDLAALTQLVQILGEETKKFIIFIDDLSFDDGEADYKALKTVLEGTLAAKPSNVLIYATSNRRHLIKEYHSDRQENELHVRDGLEEKLSLADRFGITVTFLAPDQEEYLAIVEGLVKQRNLTIDRTELRQMAIRWEMHHNGRSGRTARQFVDYLTATLSM